MPTIPVNREQVSLKATEVSARQSAGQAGAFGAALGNLGQAVSGIALDLKAYQDRQRREQERLRQQAEEKEAHAWAQEQESILQRDNHVRFNEMQKQVPEDGTGFNKTFMDTYNTDISNRIKSAPSQRAAELFQSRATQLGDNYFTQSYNWETKAKEGYTSRALERAADNRVQAALQGANPFELTAQTDADYDTNVAILGPEQAGKIRDSTKRGVALAALTREIEENPQAYLNRSKRFTGIANRNDIQADPKQLINAIATQESGNRHTNKDGSVITSKVGAQGVMQLMPDTGKELAMANGEVYDPLNEEQNRRLGTQYFEQLSAKYGDPRLALAAYNAGPGRVDKAIAKAGDGATWAEISKNLPQETQAYVPSVLRKSGIKDAPQEGVNPVTTRSQEMSDGLMSSLSVPDIMQLNNRAEVELRRIEAEKRAAAREAEQRAREGQMLARVELQDLLTANASSIAETGVPVPGVTENAFRDAYGKDWEAHWQRHMGAVGRANTIFEARTGLVDLGNDEIMQRVNSTKPTPGSLNFNDEKTAYDIVAREASAILKARAEDPIKFALQNSPTVKAAAAQLQQNPNDPAVFNNYAKAVMAAQEKYGVPVRDRRLLNDDQATAIVNQIQDAKPGKQGEVIDTITEQYKDHWPAIHKELVINGKLKEDIQPLIWLDRKTQTQARKAYGEALAEGESVIKDALGIDKVKVINDGLDDAVQDIGDTFRVAPNGAKMTSQLKQTIKLVAFNYAKTMDPKDALDRARTEIVDLGYTITNGYRVPKQFDAEVVNSMTEAYIERLKAEDLDVPGVADNDPIYVHKQKAVLDEVKSRTKWVTNKDETGLTLIHANGRMYGEPVLLRNKKMAQIRFSDVGRFQEIDVENDKYAAERMSQ